VPFCLKIKYNSKAEAKKSFMIAIHKMIESALLLGTQITKYENNKI